MRKPRSIALAFLAVAFSSGPANASFHLMQIEQAIGGVCGDVSRQAIQLRLRFDGQNEVGTHAARLRAWDITGANPVELLVFTPPNPVNGSAGSRILVTTSGLASAFGFTPDYTLTQTIPAGYLVAGRLTFEDDSGNVYWSLAWGGNGYTGSHAGVAGVNDLDGDFGPGFDGRLPFTTGRALFFTGLAADQSTSNAANYQLTGGPATLTRNAGVGTLLIDCPFGDGFELGNTAAWSVTEPEQPNRPASP